VENGRLRCSLHGGKSPRRSCAPGFYETVNSLVMMKSSQYSILTARFLTKGVDVAVLLLRRETFGCTVSSSGISSEAFRVRHPSCLTPPRVIHAEFRGDPSLGDMETQSTRVHGESSRAQGVQVEGGLQHLAGYARDSGAEHHTPVLPVPSVETGYLHAGGWMKG
jgi:hypothetical protein